MKSKFELGRLLCTPGCQEKFTKEEMLACLKRHETGDWGDVYAHDRRENDRALKEGSRLLSVYKLGEERSLWIITEADRSVTTFLLPSEY
jgi:hypothetical protein